MHILLTINACLPKFKFFIIIIVGCGDCSDSNVVEEYKQWLVNGNVKLFNVEFDDNGRLIASNDIEVIILLFIFYEFIVYIYIFPIIRLEWL